MYKSVPKIAAVRIGEEATLKRVYYDGSTITLVPANSAYRPKMYSGPALDDIQSKGLSQATPIGFRQSRRPVQETVKIALLY